LIIDYNTFFLEESFFVLFFTFFVFKKSVVLFTFFVVHAGVVASVDVVNNNV
jgi:hypothetical protein